MGKLKTQLLEFLLVAVLLVGNMFLMFLFSEGHKFVIVIRILEPILLFFLFLITHSIDSRIIENKKKHASNREAINQYYSDDDMVKLLWLNKVTFPVIWLTEGDTPIPIRSLKVYKEGCLYEPMLYGYDFGWLLDKQGRKFRLEKMQFGDIGKVVEAVKNLPVRRAVGEASEPFEATQEKILNDIKNGDSPYEEYKEEIEKAKNIEELTEIMDKVEW